jgi:hypothetical protein
MKQKCKAQQRKPTSQAPTCEPKFPTKPLKKVEYLFLTIFQCAYSTTKDDEPIKDMSLST